MRKLVVVAIAVVVVAFLLWSRSSQDAPSARPSPTALAPSNEPAPAIPVVERSLAPTEVEATAPRVEIPPEVVAPAPAPAASTNDLVEIRGRFLQPSGVPARGVALRVMGWEANEERVMRFGAPKDWKEPTGESAADGTFSLRFAPPPAYQFVFSARFAGHVTASWRWGELAAGTTRDLGDVTLELGGTIEGRVVDASGKPLPVVWRIHAEGLQRSGADGIESPRSMGSTNAGTGAFRLEGVAAGSTHLKANGRNVNWVDGPSVEVRAGETVKVDFVYSGPDFTRRITVTTFANPFHPYSDDVESIALSAPGFETRRASKLANSSQSFAFEDLPPGQYSVVIEDPKFLPWSKANVEPGQAVQAMLVGAAAIQLRVVDAQTKQPVERFAVRTRFDRVNFSPSEFEVLALEDATTANGRIEGLIPVDQTITIRAPGYSVCSLPITGFAARETRALVAELRRGARLVATVVEQSGTPIANVELTLSASGKANEERSFGEDGSTIHARTDATGRAEIDGLAAGRYRLRARRTSLVTAETDVEIGDSGSADASLVLPATVSIASKLVSSVPFDFTGMTVHAEPAEMTDEERDELFFSSFDDADGSRAPVAKDGTFRIGPLPTRSLRIVLAIAGTMVPERSGSTGIEGGQRTIATLDAAQLSNPPREIDVTALTPGYVEAQVTRGGKPIAHAVLVCSGTDQENEGSAAAILGDDGMGRTSALFPARVRAHLRDMNGSWNWTAPNEITVEPGRVTRVQIDVSVVDGVISLVDASNGAPLAGRMVLVTRTDGGSWMQTLTADAQGKLSLALDPGRYALRTLPQPGSKISTRLTAEFEWNSKGPTVTTIEMK